MAETPPELTACPTCDLLHQGRPGAARRPAALPPLPHRADDQPRQRHRPHARGRLRQRHPDDRRAHPALPRAVGRRPAPQRHAARRRARLHLGPRRAALGGDRAPHHRHPAGPRLRARLHADAAAPRPPAGPRRRHRVPRRRPPAPLGDGRGLPDRRRRRAGEDRRHGHRRPRAGVLGDGGARRARGLRGHRPRRMVDMADRSSARARPDGAPGRARRLPDLRQGRAGRHPRLPALRLPAGAAHALQPAAGARAARGRPDVLPAGEPPADAEDPHLRARDRQHHRRRRDRAHAPRRLGHRARHLRRERADPDLQVRGHHLPGLVDPLPRQPVDRGPHPALRVRRVHRPLVDDRRLRRRHPHRAGADRLPRLDKPRHRRGFLRALGCLYHALGAGSRPAPDLGHRRAGDDESMPETDPPAPEIEAPEAEGKSRRISAVWLVPLLALLLALGVAWNTYARRGPTIDIVFDDAAGVIAGQTTVRFRDVAVGVVERLSLSGDLTPGDRHRPHRQGRRPLSRRRRRVLDRAAERQRPGRHRHRDRALRASTSAPPGTTRSGPASSGSRACRASR